MAQGLREGNVKYSKTGDVNYLAKRVSSKGLLIDGTEHQIRKGTDFVTINQNEDGKVNKYEEKQVDASFKYDYSIYAKAVFEYGEDDIKTVTGDGKRFELTTKESASNTVKSILGLINNPIIKMFVGQLLRQFLTIICIWISRMEFLINTPINFQYLFLVKSFNSYIPFK